VRNKKPLLTMRTTGDNDAVTDATWCPGNATVFATVTESGKLHIWDLSVSSIDPVVNYDTSADVLDISAAPVMEKEDEGVDESDPDNLAAFQKSRREFGKDVKDEAKESPVAKLMRILSEREKGVTSSADSTQPGVVKRSLTTVLFSEKSPTIVVGDTNGAVTLYRVIDPVTVLLEGPVQQVQRLKSSILRQADPEDAAKLVSYEDSSSQSETH
jgi:WD40 repeat protein